MVLNTRSDSNEGGVQWSAEQWARVMGVLTEQQQRVVMLHVVEGLSVGEVAERMGVRRDQVSGAWRRAVARLRTAIPSPN